MINEPNNQITREKERLRNMKTKNPPTRNSMSGSAMRPITSHYSLLTVLLLALACFGLSPAPKAFGVMPPPDGGYSGSNTAEGDLALLSNTTGNHNTANGYGVLLSNTTGSDNTANGYLGLAFNTTGHANTASGYGA